jgi:hypothetical protein
VHPIVHGQGNKMNNQKEPTFGSEHVAYDLNTSRRNANYIKDQEDFPPIMWVGRQWRVDREAYEAWKILSYKKKGGK